ncbi:MAG: methyltransferase domain-containing protein [Chloroflexales bacterium]|nr:methyltransferase domain-containing protein [Chloroflexales bacterium]
MHHHPHTETLHTRGRLIRWARWYDVVVDVFTLGRASALRRATVDLAQIVPGERVLEVGCGTGAVYRVAAQRTGPSGAVAGIDPAPEMIAVAREKAARARLTIDFRVGAIEALPFADGGFAVVFSSLMMHHLPDDLKRQGLAEIRRVLQPGGRLVIVDVKRPTTASARLSAAIFLHGALSEGVQDLANVLREAGFTSIQNGDMPLGMLGYITGSTPPTR